MHRACISQLVLYCTVQSTIRIVYVYVTFFTLYQTNCSNSTGFCDKYCMNIVKYIIFWQCRIVLEHKFTFLSVDYTFLKNVNTAAKGFFSVILKLLNPNFLYCLRAAYDYWYMPTIRKKINCTVFFPGSMYEAFLLQNVPLQNVPWCAGDERVRGVLGDGQVRVHVRRGGRDRSEDTARAPD